MPILRIQVAVVARARWEVIRPTTSVWLTPASLQSRGITLLLRNLSPINSLRYWGSPSDLGNSACLLSKNRELEEDEKQGNRRSVQ